MAHLAAKKINLEELWPELEAGISTMVTNLNQGFPQKKWIELYTHVYNYCTTSRPQAANRATAKGGISGANFVGEDLYNKLVEFLKRHMKSLLKVAETKYDDSLLLYYRTEWERFTTAMNYINHIFEYLNRHWIKREADDGKKEVYQIYTLSLVIWRDHMFTPLKTRLTKAILHLIEKERNGEQIDHSLVKAVISGYVALGLNKEKPKETTLEIYQQCFEDEFIAATELYYTSESSTFIEANSVADYMKKVETRLAEEVTRVRAYLHPSSEADLISKCDRVLIEKHVETIWNEFQNLLQDDKLEDLTRMWSLLNRIPRGLDPLRTILEKHVQTVGEQAIQTVGKNAATDPKLYVETILKVFKKYNELVQGPFRNEAGFVASLDKACRRFINDNAVCKAANSASKSPELLARFCDLLLKKSAKNPEEAEMEQTLNDVMVVFKYIEDKDVFQTFYSKQLAKRLIHGTSASEDLEGQMIGKLKSTCGYEYTSKLQRMFTDMSLSRDLLERFKGYLESTAKTDLGGVDFSVLILATGSWPLQPPTTNFSIPKELSPAEELFQKFYQTAHQGRKLNWLHQLSKGELKARFGTKIFTLQSSTYQMAILLQFNNYETASFDELQVASQLSEVALKNTLLSLVKTKVLVTDLKTEDVQKTSKFSVNKAFKSKRNRVNINVPMREEQQKVADDTMNAVEEDRKLQIQAAIVRIMKMRKKLGYNNLMAEVISQLQNRFQAKPPVIKKCIDILIEKEYLERVDGQKDMLSYVA